MAMAFHQAQRANSLDPNIAGAQANAAELQRVNAKRLRDQGYLKGIGSMYEHGVPDKYKDKLWDKGGELWDKGADWLSGSPSDATPDFGMFKESAIDQTAAPSVNAGLTGAAEGPMSAAMPSEDIFTQPQPYSAPNPTQVNGSDFLMQPQNTTAGITDAATTAGNLANQVETAATAADTAEAVSTGGQLATLGMEGLAAAGTAGGGAAAAGGGGAAAAGGAGMMATIGPALAAMGPMGWAAMAALAVGALT